MIKITNNQVVNLGLPAGYTRLEYIESTSDAYIDTEVLPNQDTHIKMKTRTDQDSRFASFGARDSGLYNSFILSVSSTNGIRWDYNTSRYETNTYLDPNIDVEINNLTTSNIIEVNDTTISAQAGNF